MASNGDSGEIQHKPLVHCQAVCHINILSLEVVYGLINTFSLLTCKLWQLGQWPEEQITQGLIDTDELSCSLYCCMRAALQELTVGYRVNVVRVGKLMRLLYLIQW